MARLTHLGMYTVAYMNTMQNIGIIMATYASSLNGNVTVDMVVDVIVGG